MRESISNPTFSATDFHCSLLLLQSDIQFSNLTFECSDIWHSEPTECSTFIALTQLKPVLRPWVNWSGFVLPGPVQFCDLGLCCGPVSVSVLVTRGPKAGPNWTLKHYLQGFWIEPPIWFLALSPYIIQSTAVSAWPMGPSIIWSTAVSAWPMGPSIR